MAAPMPKVAHLQTHDAQVKHGIYFRKASLLGMWSWGVGAAWVSSASVLPLGRRCSVGLPFCAIRSHNPVRSLLALLRSEARGHHHLGHIKGDGIDAQLLLQSLAIVDLGLGVWCHHSRSSDRGGAEKAKPSVSLRWTDVPLYFIPFDRLLPAREQHGNTQDAKKIHFASQRSAVSGQQLLLHVGRCLDAANTVVRFDDYPLCLDMATLVSPAPGAIDSTEKLQGSCQ